MTYKFFIGMIFTHVVIFVIGYVFGSIDKIIEPKEKDYE
jgi:hypothetical protein